MTTRELQAQRNGHSTALSAKTGADGFLANDAEEKLVRVVDIQPEPDQPRKYLDAESLRELAESISEHGLLSPPLVHLDQATGIYRLVTGERRLGAVEQLGWETMPVRVLKERPNDEQRRILALVENVNREDLDPLELGLACHDDITKTGRTASELARIIKKNVSTVTRAMKLVQHLPGDLHEAIRLKKLPPTVARELVPLPDDDAKRRIADLYMTKELKTRADVTAAVRAARTGGEPRSPGGFACEIADVRVCVALAAGQSLAQATAAIKELLKDLIQHADRSLIEFCRFLQAKEAARKKAKELQAAEQKLAGHRPVAEGSPKRATQNVPGR